MLNTYGKLAIALSLPLACSACISPRPVSPPEINFNSLNWSTSQRPDQQPLTDAQAAAGTPSLLSDGGLNGADLISPLFPAIEPQTLREMRTAPLLWVGRDTAMVLSYEVVVESPTFAGQSFGLGEPGPWTPEQVLRRRQLESNEFARSAPLRKAKRLSLVPRGIVTPDTRQFAIYVEPQQTRVPLIGAILASWGFCGWSPAPCKPTGSLGPPIGIALETDGVRRLVDPQFCLSDPQASLFPYTVVKCRLPSDGRSGLVRRRLVVVDPANVNRLGTAIFPNRPQPPLELPEVFRVVEPLTISRRAGFESEECWMQDGQGGERPCDREQRDRLRGWRACNRRQSLPPGVRIICPAGQALGSPPGFTRVRTNWSFSVLDPSTGRLLENFEPGVRVESVKVAVTDRTGTERFLTAAEIGRIGFGGQRCQARPEESTGHGVVLIADCPNGLSPVTVAWAVRPSLTPLVWSLSFQTRANNGVLPNDNPAVEGETLRFYFRLKSVTSPQTESISQLEASIRTGSDDLRGGNDNAFIFAVLSDGRRIETSFNGGRRLSDNTSRTVDLNLPPGTALSQIQQFGIRATLGGGLSGDNWTIDAVTVRAASSDGATQTILEQSGRPLIRLTGNRREQIFPLARR